MMQLQVSFESLIAFFLLFFPFASGIPLSFLLSCAGTGAPTYCRFSMLSPTFSSSWYAAWFVGVSSSKCSFSSSFWTDECCSFPGLLLATCTSSTTATDFLAAYSSSCLLFSSSSAFSLAILASCYCLSLASASWRNRSCSSLWILASSSSWA